MGTCRLDERRQCRFRVGPTGFCGGDGCPCHLLVGFRPFALPRPAAGIPPSRGVGVSLRPLVQTNVCAGRLGPQQSPPEAPTLRAGSMQDRACEVRRIVVRRSWVNSGCTTREFRLCGVLWLIHRRVDRRETLRGFRFVDRTARALACRRTNRVAPVWCLRNRPPSPIPCAASCV